MIPSSPSYRATLPGTSRRKQAAVWPFAGAAAAVGPGYHRALESRRQALCEPLAGQCGAIAALPAGRKPPDCSPLWNAAVCWSRCRDSQTERHGGITSICPGPRNPTSCNHPSEVPPRPVGKTDRQLTDLPTPTRRKKRHDKDRMIYLSKRKIEKEFHTPRFAKDGQGLWCQASRGNHRHDNRYDGGSTGKMAHRCWLAAVSRSLPPQRAHWHFAGSAGKCHSGSDAF